MTPENVRTTPDEAMELLGLSKYQYYARLEKLDIKAKRNKGKAYLDEEQMKLLREYDSTQTALATVDDSSEIFLGNSLKSVEVTEEISSEEEEDIWRKAGEIKAKHLTSRDLLALHLAAGMKFEDLDSDLQEEVRTINAAANPENMGKSIAGTAQAMLEKRRLSQK
jgi:hypothetical protein